MPPSLSLLLRLSDLALVLAISPQLRRDAFYSSLSPFGLGLRLSLASYPSVPSPVPSTELEGARLRSPPRRKIIHPREIVQTLCSERLTPVVSCGGWQYLWQQHSQTPPDNIRQSTNLPLVASPWSAERKSRAEGIIPTASRPLSSASTGRGVVLPVPMMLRLTAVSRAEIESPEGGLVSSAVVSKKDMIEAVK